jgi:hypothetical protein
MPVIGNFTLRITQRHLLGADQALKFDLDSVFALGAVFSVPRLELLDRQLGALTGLYCKNYGKKIWLTSPRTLCA